MSRPIKFTLVSLIAAASFSVTMIASAHDFGYVQDGGGVVHSGSNLCYRTGYWTPALAIAECDPDLVKKPETPVAEKQVVTPPMAKVAPAPAKMAPRKVEFAADALFDTNKSVLKPAGIEALDSLAQSLEGVNYKMIVVIGYADYRGGAKFNQKLSERRANTVKSYLESKGIANPIVASGKGETEPKTKPGECKGKKGKALSECLEPDRRVEVNVEGEK